jgi:hypothetical protein
MFDRSEEESPLSGQFLRPSFLFTFSTRFCFFSLLAPCREMFSNIPTANIVTTTDDPP